MDSINLVPISCSQLASQLGGNETRFLVVDTRPSTQHCSKHLRNSENINFSNILLRRLLKGVVQRSTMISWELAQKLASRDSEHVGLVVYDSCSRCDSVKTELVKHAEVLARTNLSKATDSTVYFVDGGVDAMSTEYPHMCTSSSVKKAHSPLGISVSASLPIFDLSKKSKKQYPRLQTPSGSDDSQFGPPVEVLPHLILGCAKDSSNLTALRKKGVTAVLNVSHNCPNHFESLLEYRCIPVQDSYQADLLSKMDAAIDYINAIKAKNGCVFVHCHAGISRSATICIAYIMKTMQLDLPKAYEFVKEKRPCISPNLHFMGQLLEFQKQLQHSGEERMGEQSCVEDMTDIGPDTPLPTLSDVATTGMYYDVSLHDYTASDMPEEMDDYSCSHSMALPSASAPSSLNFEANNFTAPKPSELTNIDKSIQVLTETYHRPATKPIMKPRTLPLTPKSSRLQKSVSVQAPTKDRVRGAGKTSNSLPTTPTSVHCRNHMPTLSPLPQLSRMPHPLLHSPCRVAAQLGSRSESCLNYYSSLTESM